MAVECKWEKNREKEASLKQKRNKKESFGILMNMRVETQTAGKPDLQTYLNSVLGHDCLFKFMPCDFFHSISSLIFLLNYVITQ